MKPIRSPQHVFTFITVLTGTLFIITAASAESLSPRSGNEGDIIKETRGNDRSYLRGLIILEKSDRPCVVQIYGNLVRVKDYTGRIEECSGSGPKMAKGVNSSKGQVFISGGSSYVHGLKLCLSSSNRVKGWTIYGKSAYSPNEVSDSFRRTNCPNGGWQRRVDCPDNTKAIGVRAHFMAASGNKSDSLTGMQLICDDNRP